MPLAPTFALSGVTSYAPPALARAMPPRDAFFAIPSASEKGEPMKMFDLRKMAREAGVLDAIDGAMDVTPRGKHEAKARGLQPGDRVVGGTGAAT
jgi:hypothetical protein